MQNEKSHRKKIIWQDVSFSRKHIAPEQQNADTEFYIINYLDLTKSLPV